MPGKVIIGIHGLKNKPPRWLLKYWWKKSVREGLGGIDASRWFVPFDLAYWAHVRHPRPLSFWVRDPEHPRFMNQPYRRRPAGFHEKAPLFRKPFLYLLERSMDRILLGRDMRLNFSKITDNVIQKYFDDLAVYSSDDAIRDQIQARLLVKLRRHRRKKILLVAHSMGTLIAYDVLSQHKELQIDTLITLGSPLGLPNFLSRTCALHGLARPTVPTAIQTRWINMADLSDPIAMNYNLADDYAPNASGVGVQDILVLNDYITVGERSPHKSYGYLRTPQIAAIFHNFLND